VSPDSLNSTGPWASEMNILQSTRGLLHWGEIRVFVSSFTSRTSCHTIPSPIKNKLAWKLGLYILPYFICSWIGIVRSAEGSDFESRQEQRFSPFHVVHTDPGTHRAPYSIGTEGYFPGLKRPGSEADDLPPSGTEITSTWIYTSTPQYVFIA
jgi:hypothetical protein